MVWLLWYGMQGCATRRERFTRDRPPSDSQLLACQITISLISIDSSDIPFLMTNVSWNIEQILLYKFRGPMLLHLSVYTMGALDVAFWLDGCTNNWTRLFYKSWINTLNFSWNKIGLKSFFSFPAEETKAVFSGQTHRQSEELSAPAAII